MPNFKLSNLMQILIKFALNTNSVKEKCICLSIIYDLLCLNPEELKQNIEFEEIIFEHLLYSSQKMETEWKEYKEFYNPIKYLEELFPKKMLENSRV